MTSKRQPPRWADRLLETFVSPHLREDVQGDLHEVYYKRVAEVGLAKARREFVWAVLNYLKPFFFKRKKSAYSSPSLFGTAMLRNYLLIAFRTLTHNKVYSAINVVGLSLGLAAAMLIILYTKDEVSFDRFHTRADRIYRIVMDQRDPTSGNVMQTGSSGLNQGPKFTAGIPEVESFVRVRAAQWDIKKETEIKSEELIRTDANFFSVFSFPLLHGDPKTALLQPNAIVLSEEMANRYFGTTDALGKTLQIRAKEVFEPYIVTGVAKESPQNSSIKFRFLVPMVISPQDIGNPDNWGSYFLNTFVVLNPGADVKTVEAKMKRIYETDARQHLAVVREKFNDRSVITHSLQPLTAIHLNEKAYSVANGLKDSSSPLFSYLLSGIALFILVIACINFVNLTVARSLKRAKEIGVRKVVGGGRRQLILQFLGESFLLCFAAFLLAVLLVELILPSFNELSKKALALDYLFDWKLVSGYGLLFLATGFLAGFYPALIISGYSPIQALYGRFTVSGKSYLQKGLVVLQFTLASFLIIATLTVFSQFNYLINKPLGYDYKNTILVYKKELKRSEVQLFRQELLKHPGFVAVSTKNGGRSGTGAIINGETEVGFDYETIDEFFIPTYRIPVLKGRNFSTRFPSDSARSVLVNESFVKMAGWKNPVGQTIDFKYLDHKKYTVVGVVKDYHFRALSNKIEPQLFTMRPQNALEQLIIRIKPGTETASLAHLERTFQRLFPLVPFAYEFKEQQLRKAYESEAKWKQIMLFGAILTIFISCIGLFGLATLSAERRTKEVGIRKVLGASVSSIVQLLSSDFLKLVGFSFVFAFPAAYYAIEKWLQNYPYRVDISVWSFALAAGLSILIAFFTVSFQSIRAALMNPVSSLRSE